MKYYLYVVNRELLKTDLIPDTDYMYVANIHDAINIETTPEFAEIICPILIDSFQIASDDLGLKYPVHGQPSVGQNQWETH